LDEKTKRLGTLTEIHSQAPQKILNYLTTLEYDQILVELAFIGGESNIDQ
jgi:hypothetical protein